MPDGSNYIAAAAEPPKPELPRPYNEPYIRDPVFCYALQGPDGWHNAMVEKEPFPDAYVLTIWKAGNRTAILYRDTFATWRGQLRDEDTPYHSFQALLGGAIKATTGSVRGWTMLSRPNTTDEQIDLNTEGELRHPGVALRNTQAEPGRR